MTEEKAERVEMQTTIFRQEGTILFVTEDAGAIPVIACLVVAAIPGDNPGEMGLRWRVHGDPVYAVPTLAKFLQLNPAFSMAVQGTMGMMASGRLDGLQGHCHHHEAPEEG